MEWIILKDSISYSNLYMKAVESLWLHWKKKNEEIVKKNIIIFLYLFNEVLSNFYSTWIHRNLKKILFIKCYWSLLLNMMFLIIFQQFEELIGYFLVISYVG